MCDRKRVIDIDLNIQRVGERVWERERDIKKMR